MPCRCQRNRCAGAAISLNRNLYAELAGDGSSIRHGNAPIGHQSERSGKHGRNERLRVELRGLPLQAEGNFPFKGVRNDLREQASHPKRQIREGTGSFDVAVHLTRHVYGAAGRAPHQDVDDIACELQRNAFLGLVRENTAKCQTRGGWSTIQRQ